MVRPRKELDISGAFQPSRILTLPQACQRLKASRSTVLRRLGEHGYYSSYNHAGRFLTIEAVAEFDARGLWCWKTARFSKHGNLKQTVCFFVEDNQAGMTQEELARLLRVRTHNPLLELVEENRVCRERLGPTFVYLSRRRSRRSEQRRRRRLLLARPKAARPTSRQIIATLLELIRNPQAERQQIVRRCQRSGVSISRELVDSIFEKYDLDKKRAR